MKESMLRSDIVVYMQLEHSSRWQAVLAPALLLCYPQHTDQNCWPPGPKVDVQAPIVRPPVIRMTGLLILIFYVLFPTCHIPLVSRCLESLIHTRVVRSLMSFLSCSYLLEPLDIGTIWYIYLFSSRTAVQLHVPALGSSFLLLPGEMLLTLLPWQPLHTCLVSLAELGTIIFLFVFLTGSWAAWDVRLDFLKSNSRARNRTWVEGIINFGYWMTRL